mmetsp:Transcript_3496/g.9837  ORF Transcript_3496/g.9837 Transcript_3496/m.9837 type:complete len:233 (+) Transcript_3496:449-1147(+)
MLRQPFCDANAEQKAEGGDLRKVGGCQENSRGARRPEPPGGELRRSRRSRRGSPRGARDAPGTAESHGAPRGPRAARGAGDLWRPDGIDSKELRSFQGPRNLANLGRGRQRQVLGQHCGDDEGQSPAGGPPQLLFQVQGSHRQVSAQAEDGRLVVRPARVRQNLLGPVRGQNLQLENHQREGSRAPQQVHRRERGGGEGALREGQRGQPLHALLRRVRCHRSETRARLHWRD